MCAAKLYTQYLAPAKVHNRHNSLLLLQLLAHKVMGEWFSQILPHPISSFTIMVCQQKDILFGYLMRGNRREKWIHAFPKSINKH